MSPAPMQPPIGLALTEVSRAVSRAFDAALTAAGGSLPAWLVLLACKSHPSANQSELAGTVGIHGATLTHHLNAMESDGLLSRRRDPANRRVHIVELTPDGEAAFRRLRDVAVRHDRRLRAGFSESELATLRGVLARMRANVTDT